MVNDLAVLPAPLQRSARRDANGELSWSLTDAPAVIAALATAGRRILGLDLRTYDEVGTFFEVPWSSYDGSSVDEARDAALTALARPDLPGDWVLITW